MAGASLNCWSCGGRVAGGICLTCGEAEEGDPLLGSQIGALRICGHLLTEPESVIYEVEPIEGETTALALRLLPRDLWGEDAALATFSEAGRIHHVIESPHVATCVDYGQTANGAGWHLLHWVAGRELRALLRERRGSPLALARVLDIGRQMAAAVRALHERGAVHGRLSLDSFRNLSAFSDTSDWIQLLHPGRCRVEAPASRRGLPDALSDSARWQGGSPWRPYEPPEGGPLLPTADVFALGAILYHLLTGRQPYGVRRSSGDEVTPILSRRPELKEVPVLREVVEQAMSLRPADRYPDAIALHQALERAAKNPRGLLVAARRPAPAPAAPAPRPPAAASQPPAPPQPPPAAAPRPRPPAAKTGELARPDLRSGTPSPPPRAQQAPERVVVDEVALFLEELASNAPSPAPPVRMPSAPPISRSLLLSPADALREAAPQDTPLQQLIEAFAPLSAAYTDWAQREGSLVGLRLAASSPQPSPSESLLFGARGATPAPAPSPPPRSEQREAVTTGELWLAVAVRQAPGAPPFSAGGLAALEALARETQRSPQGGYVFLIASQSAAGGVLGRVITALMTLERLQRSQVPAVGIASLPSGAVPSAAVLSTLAETACHRASTARVGEVLVGAGIVQSAGLGGVFQPLQDGRGAAGESLCAWSFAQRA